MMSYLENDSLLREIEKSLEQEMDMDNIDDEIEEDFDEAEVNI